MKMYRLLIAGLLTVILFTVLNAQTLYNSTTEMQTATEDGFIFHAGGQPSHPFPLDNWSVETGGSMLASPKLADLNGDGVDEILISTYSAGFYVYDGDGNLMPGFPVTLVGNAPASPAVGDIDNDGDMEIVQGTWTSLYVLNANGTNYPGFPIPMYVTQTAALEDLDLDGDLEIIVPSGSSMHVLNHDGSNFPGFPVTAVHDLTSAAVGQIDDSDWTEIAAGSFVASGSPLDYVYAWHGDGTTVQGYPVSTAGSVKSAPALGDLNGDGLNDVLAPCWNQSGTDLLYAWEYHGYLLTGFPISLPYIRLSSPSLADMDDDGDLEIIIGGWSTSPSGEVIHVYHHNGTPLTGFPVTLANNPSGNVNSTPTVGDIDGDGMPEIVLKATNKIYAVNHDGTVVTGFPVILNDNGYTGTSSPSPAIGDPDDDGLLEIIAASNYSTVMSIDQPGEVSLFAVDWGSYKNDQYNRGRYIEPELPNLSVGMFGYGMPIVIPPGGGSFEFNIEITNDGDTPAEFDVWTTATLPNGSEYGPIILVTDLNLPGGFSVNRDREQAVPGGAPSGNYTYYAYVGIYPNLVIDNAILPFSKQAH